MKNLNLLPISEEHRDRLKKFAAMHRMYGGPRIDIQAVVLDHVLVSILYKGDELSPDDLTGRADEMFAGELPETLRLHYAIWREEPEKIKHVVSRDGYVFRVDKGPYMVRLAPGDSGDLDVGGQRVAIEPVAGDLTPILRTQLEKWLPYAVREGLAELPNLEADSIRHPPALRPIAEVLNEVFAQSPLPNRLKSSKQHWLRGTLGATAQVRIVEEYTDYQCQIVCAQTPVSDLRSPKDARSPMEPA